MVLELMLISICVGRLMVNEPPESRDGEFKTSDVLITVLTSAALPVASRILTLAFGDNSLWSSTDCSLSILHHFQDGY